MAGIKMGIINTLQGWGQYCWNAPSWFGPLVVLVVIWSIIWKGLALWRAAKNSSKAWFIVLLIVNTIGILDILYLYVFSKRRAASSQSQM